MMKVNFPARVSLLHVLLILAPLILPVLSYGQQDTTNTVPDGTEGAIHKIYGVDSVTGRAEKLPMNEFDNAYSTFKIGLGYNHDFVNYIQDDVFKQQMDTAGFHLGPTFKVRDFRVLFSGLLKTKRTIAWKFAYMYDGDNERWLIRETGVIIGVPELFGHIFIGRTKEGYSLVKVMNGHFPWTMERQMALDPIPILADGIKWFGSLPKSRIFWNLGAFNDVLSKGQSYSTYSWQYVARIGWMPFNNKEKNIQMHIAANLRYAKPLDGQMIIKSRPESNPTPQLINTGTFQTDKSSHLGAEIYFSSRRWMVGSEIMWHNFYSKSAENHQYFGGDAVVTYSITGGVRPYNTRVSIYGYMPVKKSVFKGGWGEWEAVLHYSTFNLNDRSIRGGQFWKITPMVNWYLSQVVRMEFAYGYGVLDRYNLKGGVQFFQSRIQFTIM
jgi:phosphate-selective porin OprO and OprP